MKTSIELKHDSAGRPIYARTGLCIPLVAPMVEFPYYCNDCATLQVYCRTSEEIMRKYLEKTPFEFVSADYILNISDMSNVTSTFGGMMDIAVIVPVRYKDHLGGHYLIEFENNDITCILGREMWGYPKLLADATLEEKDGKIIATGTKRGVEMIHLELDLNAPPQKPFPQLQLKPHLQLHTIPAPDGPYIFSQRLLSRDTSADFQLKSSVQGAGTCVLQGVVRNPLDEFAPEEVYGAVYEVGDFNSTADRGWAKVLATII